MSRKRNGRTIRCCPREAVSETYAFLYLLDNRNVEVASLELLGGQVWSLLSPSLPVLLLPVFFCDRRHPC